MSGPCIRHFALAALLLLTACSGKNAALPEGTQPLLPATATAQDWPVALPVDTVLPGEELNAAGKVQPQRSALSFDASTNFTRGADFDSAGGTVLVSSQGASFTSGSAGGRQLSFALYRIPLGGAEPGAVAIDANLRAVTGGTGRSSFYVGLSDYSQGRWNWSGPFSDNHVRLSTAVAVKGGTSYVSGLGNLYVALIAFDGADFDLVGVGVSPFDSLDSTAPSAPAALGVTASPGSFLVEWTPSAAGDLAGYRLHYSDASFASSTDPAVEHLEYLEGAAQHVLALPAGGARFFAVSAVDYSGNESALSNLDSAAAPVGAAPQLIVTSSNLAGKIGSPAILNVSGADSYDFDLDGDGLYDISDSTSTQQDIDTSRTGIIRPGVRGHGSGGTVALGGVSLIISAGFAPVALLDSDLDKGLVWGDGLDVNFDASGSSDVDTAAGSLQYSFDPEGDGTFTAFASSPLKAKTYTSAGTKLAAVRVRDPEGYEDVGYHAVQIQQGGAFRQLVVDRNDGTGAHSSLQMVDGCPAVAYCAPVAGDLLYCRALDSAGEQWGEPVQLDTGGNLYTCLAVIKNHPAIVYYNVGAAELRYIRASNTDGQKASNWSNAHITLGGLALLKPCLLDCNGNPAIVYTGASDNLYFRRATGASGSGDLLTDWTDPQFPIVTSGVRKQPVFRLVDGNPAVLFTTTTENLRYMRATSATGASSLDWGSTNILITGMDHVGESVDLAIVDGQPAVTWLDVDSEKVKYMRADSSTGTAVGDWTTQITLLAATGVGNCLSMAVLSGRPALAIADSQNIGFIRYTWASDALGSSWPVPKPAVSIFDGGANGPFSLADVGGLPAISYHSEAYDCLGFAVPDLD